MLRPPGMKRTRLAGLPGVGSALVVDPPSGVLSEIRSPGPLTDRR